MEDIIENELPIIWEIVEQVLDHYYFAYSPGHHGDLVHLSDDCFIGYSLNHKNDEICLFDYYDCDFNDVDHNDNFTGKGIKEWKYKIPTKFVDLLDLLNKHNLLFDDQGYEIDKKFLIKEYIKRYKKQTYTKYQISLSEKYKDEIEEIKKREPNETYTI